ncbi:hypothetical protein BJ508DRAFT_411417 [Ascobolus immersus RN42]|uniref:Mediator of RNA polymerase II transcription subunit 7 n=1 Tax=Ascobolus immersus RN42 TaxID=1160509 RepID=A0A3N4ILE4_ASCIM|nr:hypothetical protein BJ508DRAFT_411417 [Ascobolus immersus RN42]
MHFLKVAGDLLGPSILILLLPVASALPLPYTPRLDQPAPEAYHYPEGYHPMSEQWQYKYDPKWLESLNYGHRPGAPGTEHMQINMPLAYIEEGADPATAMPQLITLFQNLQRFVVQRKNQELAQEKLRQMAMQDLGERVKLLKAALRKKQGLPEEEEEEEEEKEEMEVEAEVEVKKPVDDLEGDARRGYPLTINGAKLDLDEYGRWRTG